MSLERMKARTEKKILQGIRAAKVTNLAKMIDIETQEAPSVYRIRNPKITNHMIN